MTDRRSFLAGTAALSGAGHLAAAAPPAKPDDLAFTSALDVARAIRSRQVSAVEVTRLLIRRIRAHARTVNAVVTVAEEQALARARQADEAVARRRSWGPFHGVLFTVKDAFETAGVRTVCGTRELAKYVPRQSAAIVERLEAAGAILLGKTNTPEWAGDSQTFNDVFGLTRNPYNGARTAGGSSGGSAAAVAAGHSYLDVGSDLGGSIRLPAHFCGIYGHKPTLNLVPARGHIPPRPGQPMPPLDLAVVGPFARTASDLLAVLAVLGGPDRDEAIAYRWSLPPPRAARLRDYRIGYVLDYPGKSSSRRLNPPLTPQTRAVFDEAIRALRRAGARLVEGWPAGVKPGEQFEAYMFLRTSFHALGMDDRKEAQLRQRAAKKDESDEWWEAHTWTAPHKRWLQASQARLAARAAWQDYFRTHDAFLTPTLFTSAFRHDTRPDDAVRMATHEGTWDYLAFRFWIVFATLAGLPATVAPIGLARSGLPVGAQIIGPYLEDATPIDIAGRLAEVLGGFRPPKGL